MWRAYVAFMREKYSHVIIATLVAGLITGLFSTAPGFFIRRFATLLIVIMIGAMGFTIRLRSLNRALKGGWAFMPAVSASADVFLMFIAVNTSVPLVRSNLAWIGPLAAAMVLVFPVLFIGAYAISRAFLPTGKNIAITFSSGMKNLPIAVAIAAVSFNEVAMFPVALGFAFQMITAVCFYRMFMKTYVPNPPQPATVRPSARVND
jgi:hypothetical protein